MAPTRTCAPRSSALFRMYLFVTMLLSVAGAPQLQAQTTVTGNTDFGSVNVGSSGAAQTLTFSFSSPASLNTAAPVQVLTTGVSGLDFKNAGTGTCGGSTYSTCTVDVAFAPLAPGLRMGAVELKDAGGNVLATVFVHGTGQGPRVVFDTSAGSLTAIGSTSTTAQAVAVDAAGNVYIADNGGGAVYKVTPAGVQTTVAGGLTHPDGIAVDGAGNVYVASGSPSVTSLTKITPAGAQSTLGSGISFGAGMAVDAAGNVYVAATGSNTVVKLTPAGMQTTVGTGLSSPDGVAVDAAGNLYIANATNSGSITRIAPDGTQTTPVSGLYYPENVTVDPAGNIYVSGYTQLVEYSPTGTQLRVIASSIANPVDAVFDGAGNLYVANGSITKVDRADAPTVAFLSSSAGSTSTDSPEAVTVENDGNAPLSFPVPASGSNPTLSDAADFSIDSSTTCPQLIAGGATPGTLASGAACIYALDFKPTTAGAITGTLTLTDNSLNAGTATQVFTLNNQGVPKIIKATVTVGTVVTTYTGQPIPVPVTTDPPGLDVAIVYTPIGSTTGSSVDPTGPGFFTVTATVTTPGYSGSGSGYLIINSPPPPATPVITWPTPTPIAVGTALSATQLNATANTAGTFTYSPAAGTVLAPGTYTLTTTFRPTDTTDYQPVTTATVTLVVQPNANSSPVNFGAVNLGASSSTQTVTFTFVTAQTLSSTTPVQVLTQGTANLDFHDTGAGNCSGSYAAGGTCTVTVNFTPVQAGGRAGAVVLLGTSGGVLASAGLYGVGQGPEVAFDPGTQSMVGKTLIAEGAAADSAGNLYVNTGIALVKVASDGTQTPISGNFATDGSYSSEGGTAIDGAGNVYVADTFNNRVMEYTPGGASYTVGTGFNIPYGVAVDPAGTIYVADTKNSQVVKIDTTGAQTVFATGFVYPEAVTTDSAGNVYVVDNATPSGVNPTPAGIVYKYTPGGTKSIVVAGLLSPSGAAVDASGNVFVTDESKGLLIKVNPSGVQISMATGLGYPFGVALDGKGDLYVSHVSTTSGATNGLLKIDRSTSPSLSFVSTVVGSISSDSPQTVTVENIGTSDLHFAVGQTAISANFALDHPTCPVPASTPGTLASAASCTYPIDFKPAASGSLAGTLTIGDDALNAGSAIQTIALSGTGTGGVTSATVTLGDLSQTYTGSPLPVSVSTTPAGLAVRVTYNGSATVPTAAGSYSVVATITDPNYSGSASGTLIIAQATPAVTWATPAAISYGKALSATQLNATASVPGSFVYTPAAGVLPVAGTDTLSVTFTPSDAVDYASVTKTVSLVVSQATPVIAWAAPVPITYGTALSGAQLNATASVAGTFAYSPVAGTVLGVGSNKLTVTFTPTDATDYSAATGSVFLTVNPAAPTITWATPAPIVVGTALSATQLNATASVPGTFVYSPPAGTVPGLGPNQLSVTFTPDDATDYTTGTATVVLQVNAAATPSITWATPVPIVYGTALSATQLNATASVPGAFVYTPAAGTVPGAGSNKLSVTFTPTDTVNYTTATASVILTVNQATPTVTWAAPASIDYGIALSSAQLNATASVPGTFVYSPAAGAVLPAGTQTLTVTFTPTDTADYATAKATVNLGVNQASLTVSARNATRVYGTANPTFSGNVSGNLNGDTFTESFTTTATAASPAGTYAIVPSVTGANLANYTVTVMDGTLTVAQAGSTTALQASATSIAAGQTLTLTVQVASGTTGTPSGNVQFYDGANLLATAALSGGSATVSTGALAPGSHALTAVYTGDVNFTGSNSGTAISVTVTGTLDFTISAITATNTVLPGSAASYSFTVTPANGTYPANVNFTATGLPPGATATFSPASIAANAGAQTVVVSIQTAAVSAFSHGKGAAPIVLALLLLPISGWRRARLAGRRSKQILRLLLFLVLMTAGMAGMTGCGTGNGYLGQGNQSYTVTLTATSGAVQHSATVTLNVE